MTNLPLPFISIIIPVFNDAVRLKSCLQALEQQTYPHNLYEVIVIDNNSTEDIKSIATEFKQVKLGFESQPGSYAARNKGISLAKGEIFAFIDSDCVPVTKWIEYGVQVLKVESADLVGGEVTFTFSPQKTLSEIYDSMTNMQIRQNIQDRKVCKTANLFVKKYVFESVGLFPDNLKSGGDVIWTKKATDAGFKLVYSAEAQVFHPARKLLPLLKKQYRVGCGQPYIWVEQGQTKKQMLLKTINSFRPPSPREFWKLTHEHKVSEIRGKFLELWILAWLYNFTMNLARLNTIIKENFVTK
jgi:glycosyltransferase involved in cell wall biosynthesis